MALNLLEFTSLLFRFAASLMAFFFCILSFSKVKKEKRTGIDLSVLIGFGIFVLFCGIMEIIMIYYCYFLYLDYQLFSLYLTFQATGLCAITGLVFFSEKMLGKTKFGFTIFTIICIFIEIFFIHTINGLTEFSTIVIPISMIIVTLNYIYSLIFRMKGEVRKKMFATFMAAAGFFGFYIIQTDFERDFIPIPGEISVIIGDIGIIICLTIWVLIFLSFETFTEFLWREKMKELFIIAPNGATLFYYSFIKKTTLYNPDLISSSLTGIKDILAEMMQSKQPMKMVDHHDIKIFFEYGVYSTIVLIASENLRIYHSKLAILLHQFENIFQDVLIHWKGETDIFLLTKRLLENILGQSS